MIRPVSRLMAWRRPAPATVTRWPSIAAYMRARHPAFAAFPHPAEAELPSSPGYYPAATPNGGGDFLEVDRAVEVDYGVND